MKFTLTFLLLATTASTTFASKSRVEEVVTTATLSEQAVFDVLGSASVINQVELKQSQSLPEALEYQSGLQIVRNGGQAAQTSLFTRGTNSDHTLILVNGIRFNSATAGQTALQFIDPEQINRVEIVKGSRSALYGSDAIGGVMQIFTNKAPEQRQGYLSLQGGSLNTRRIAGGLSDKVNNAFYSLSLSREISDGMDNLVDDTGFNADDDPYGITSGNLVAGVELSEKLKLSFTHFSTRSTANYDTLYSGATAQPYDKNSQNMTSLLLDADLSSWYGTQLTVGQSEDNSENLNFQNTTDKSNFDTKRDSVYWLNSFSILPILTIDAGFDYTHETVDSSTIYQNEQGQVIKSRDNAAVFAQTQLDLNDFTVVAGIRRDDNESYDTHTSANAAMGYQVDAHVRIFASWGEGFKAPTFNDLHWPNSGNPDLLPETSTSREFGVKGHWDNASFTFSGFQMSVDNLINWAPDNDGDWRPRNINNADIEGLELDFDYRHATGYSINSTLTYTDAVDAVSGETLANRAKKKLTANISRPFGRHSAGIGFKAESKRRTSTGTYLPGYATLNFYASAALRENLSFKLMVSNVTDKDYQVNERYNTDGANINLQLTYRF